MLPELISFDAALADNAAPRSHCHFGDDLLGRPFLGCVLGGSLNTAGPMLRTIVIPGGARNLLLAALMAHILESRKT